MLHASLLLVALAADPVHDEALRLLHLEDVSVQHLDLPADLDAGLLVEVELDGLPFALDLRRHSMRTPGYQLLVDVGGVVRPAEPGPERTLRGSALEDPDAVVAGGLLADGLYARIELSSGAAYWVEPLVGRAPSATVGQHAVYRDGDVLPSTHTCGVDRLVDSVLPPGEGVADGGYNKVCELAVDADFQYFQDYGSVSATESKMATVINAMNVQYERDVRITHVLSASVVRTTSGGGGYTSSDPGTLLSQFRSEWTSNQLGVPRDVAELFTGRNLSGSVIGIAFPNGICSFGQGYNLVQSDFSGNFSCSTDLSAHELGHNWSAGHCTCGGHTMNPSITCGNQFHPDFTQPKIIGFRDSRTCLDDEFDGDVLFADNFESGNFTAKGWTISDPTRCKVKRGAASEGEYGAKLKKGGVGTGACTVGTSESWIEAPPVDTTGYASVRVLMAAHVRNNTLGCENMDLQWWDGSAWQSAGIVEKHAWDGYEIWLPAGAGDNPALRVRLITNCKGQKERGEVDNFCIVGL